MMHKLTYKAQLSQNRQLTGAATPCLPTIPAEGKTSNLSVCQKLPACQITSSKASEWELPQGRQPKDRCSLRDQFIREGNNRGLAADAATGIYTTLLSIDRGAATPCSPTILAVTTEASRVKDDVDRMHVSTAISNVRFMSVSDVTLMHYVTDVLAVDSIAGSRYGR
jgi:hypothetical protein